MTERPASTRAIRRDAGLLLLVAAALIGGVWLRPLGQAQADVRKETPREHFKSGGERSEVVLKEISDTLKQIDGRLERIEKALLRAADRATQ